MAEMKYLANKNQDCWLTRVQNMEKILLTPKLTNPSKTSGRIIQLDLRTKFDLHWYEEVNRIKL